MARENLPNISTTLTDGNLEALPPVDLGDRIVLIGTAEKGPVDQPIVIRNPEEAISTFGSIDKGNLVEGYAECFYAPGGDKDIRLVRISNGETAKLDLYEQSLSSDQLDSSPQDRPSTYLGEAVPALRLESLYPGSIYNSISFRMDTVDRQLSVVGYNPETEEETVIPYDPSRSVSGSVYDVKSLADAINVDPNLGSVVTAEANRIHAIYELDVQDDWSYITSSNGTITIDLPTALGGMDVAPDPSGALPGESVEGTIDLPRYADKTTLNADITATIATIVITTDGSCTGAEVVAAWPATGYIKVYVEDVSGEEDEVEIIKYSAIADGGGNLVNVTVDPAAYATGASLLGRGWGGTNNGTQGEGIAHELGDLAEFYLPIFPTPISVTAADGIEELLEVYELDNLAVDLDAAGKVEVELPYPIQMATNISRELLELDGTEDLAGDGKAKHILTNSYIATADGETKVFQFTAYVAMDDTTLSVYRTSLAGTTVEITSSVTVNAVGGTGQAGGYSDYVAEIELDNEPQDGSIITVSYESVEFQLTQLATLGAIQASTSFQEYFAAGEKITFGTAQPADIKITYPAKITYKIGTEAVVSGTNESQIVITAVDRDIDVAGGTVIGLDYYYQPEWVSLNAAQALQGGTDGINMSNAEKYKLLTTLYETIADYSADIFVPLRTYLDDIKIEYDPESGVPVEVNAGFTAQLSTFLEQSLEGVNEAYGIISVKPADGSTLSDINDWYEKLITSSYADNTRAANVMEILNARLLDVCAMDLIVTNNVAGAPYITTGEAVLAGMAAKLDPHSATTNKSLGANVLGLRYKLSSKRLNTLTGLRYVTARIRSGVGVVVTDGVTAASPGSDWERRSTFRIMAAAMDVVRQVGEPYLGEGFSPARKAALETAITKGLVQMQELGALQNFTFNIEQTPVENTRGIARVNLILQPAYELRKIRVTVKLSATGA